jgi:hypothetical protein
MNTTRTLFGRHREGYIIPLLLNVKPLENCFAGVIVPLHTLDQFVLFTSDSFTVTAATKESCAVLKVHPMPVVNPAQICPSEMSLRLPQIPPSEVSNSRVTMLKALESTELVDAIEDAANETRSGGRQVSRRRKVNSFACILFVNASAPYRHYPRAWG